MDNGCPYRFVFNNCKITSGVIKCSSSTNVPSDVIIADFVNCDSSGTNYHDERYTSTGSHGPETTIVRTGGATDGVTALARKIVTTSLPTWENPFECVPLVIYNTTVGSTVNVTVYGIWDAQAVPNNDDIWIEVSYFGLSGSPQASYVNTTKANSLTSNLPCSTDTSSWGGSTTPFKMAAALNNVVGPYRSLAGPIYVTVKVAKPSNTFYIDPAIVLS